MPMAGLERPEAAPVRSHRGPARRAFRENGLMATDDAGIQDIVADRPRSELS